MTKKIKIMFLKIYRNGNIRATLVTGRPVYEVSTKSLFSCLIFSNVLKYASLISAPRTYNTNIGKYAGLSKPIE